MTPRDAAQDTGLELGSRLRYIRKELGWTQARMADSLAISLSHYSKLEIGVGRMSPLLVLALCEKLGVRRDWLKTGAGSTWKSNRPPEAAGLPPEVRDDGVPYGSPAFRDAASLERIVALAQDPELQKLAAGMAARLGLPRDKALASLIQTALQEGTSTPAAGKKRS